MLIDLSRGTDGEGHGPSFSLDEHAIIRRWSARMRRRGLRVRIVTHYDGIDEVLQITPRWEDAPRWMVWRTEPGNVAVTLSPGLPALVPTLEEALAIIQAELDTEDA